MTREAQRIAIATACGWTEIISTPHDPMPPKGRECKGANWGKPIPDYLSDLNACHEMEKVLDYEQCEIFSNMVADIVQAANREKDYAFPWCFARIHATASEKCEAFLRTLGLWEDAQ